MHLLAVQDDDTLVAVVNTLTREVVAYATFRIDTVHLGDAGGLFSFLDDNTGQIHS